MLKDNDRIDLKKYMCHAALIAWLAPIPRKRRTKDEHENNADKDRVCALCWLLGSLCADFSRQPAHW
jgi:hypothetical protein